MMKHDSLYNVLAEHFTSAVAQVAGVAAGRVDPALRPATDPKFGDYQCNIAMSLARSLKAKPRDIAQRIKDAVEPGLAEIAEPLEIAGPGFLNIRLKDEFLARYLGEIPAPPAGEEGSDGGPTSGRSTTFPRSHAALDRVGLAPVERPSRVVVEYSQPNIAKQMHVGHLRSTIIGDMFARVLEFEGHEVIRQNHIGDWGTSLGAVITGLWYTRARRQRGEDLKDIVERQRWLAGLKGKSAQERKTALATLRDEWEEDLKDLDLDNPSDQEPDIEELETAYVFVQTLVEVARDTGLRVRYKRDDEERDDPIVDIPRNVTAMMQSATGKTHQSEFESWKQARDLSVRYCQAIYGRLAVLLQPNDVRGESFYNDRLQPLVDELRRLLPARHHGSGSGDQIGGPTSGRSTTLPRPHAEVRDDQGAVCAFLHDDAGQPMFKNPDGEILPLIIQKSDGAFLYATTDLAAIRFRLQDLKAGRVIYVTDARQKLHFDMWMATARAADWIAPDVSVEHVTFGTVLGSDRRPLKTRDGGTIKLRELLDEAEARALELLRKRAAESDEGPDGAGGDGPSDDEMRGIASAVGVASIKYADLRNDRNSDYVFAWDKMISFQGNTAPYMMYAYARIRSIYRKAAERFGSPDVYAPQVGINIVEPAERMLALKLGRLREAIDAVASDLTPHTLCAYLYDLASEFMRFYESCPVLAAPDEPTRLSRMRLCDLTARTLKLGLGLLGIDVIERM